MMKAAPDWLVPDERGEVSDSGIQGTFNGPNDGAGGLGGWVCHDAGADSITLDGDWSATMLRELADMMEASR
jgi:hypothetical protein